MMKNIVTLLIYICLVYPAFSQNCTDYNRLVSEGKTFLGKNNKQYRLALNKFNAAKLCDPSKSIEVDKLITTVFDAIEKEKEEAVRLRKSAENEKIALYKLQETNSKNEQLEIEKRNELIRSLKLENEKLEMEKISNLDYELRSNSSILIKKVITLLKEEKSKEALEILVGLTKESPKSVVDILENKPSFSNKIKLSESLSLIQDRILAFRSQAMVFSVLNDTLNELKIYKQLIKLDSTDFMGYYDLAKFHKKYKNYSEAKRYSKTVLKFVERENIRGEVLYNLGEINKALGNTIESIESFKEASYCFERLYEDSPIFKLNFEESLENIIQLFEISNQKTESIQWREKLWSIFPEKRVEANLGFFQIKGIVTELSSGNRPIANVVIKSIGANPVLTDANGRFVLIFPNYNIKEKITLKAEKPEWEIVNEKELIDLVPFNLNERYVKIILSKSVILAQNRAKFYDLFLKRIQIDFDKKSKMSDKKELAILKKEYYNLLENAGTLADLISRKNFDDLSMGEREAINNLNEKGLSGYIEYLENVTDVNNLENLIEQRKKIVINKEIAKIEIEKAESIIEAQLSKLRFSAKEYILNYDFVKAERVYKILVEADSLNFDNTYDFAYFLQTQNRLNEAEKLYRKSLYLTKDEDKVANVNNNLGIVYLLQNDFVRAQIMLSEALDTREKIVKNNPIEYNYSYKLVETLKNLGELFKNKNSYQVALSYYLKALAILEWLKYNSPSSKNIDVEMAKINNNLGVLYFNNNQIDLAQNSYQNAIDIYNRLDANNPDFGPYLASSLNNLGILYQAKNDYGSALTSFQKTLEIRELLAKINPAVYEVEVAIAQNNLGALYQSIKEYPSALYAYRKAFEIYSRLFIINPAIYEIDFCRSIILLGFLQKEGYKKDNQIINEKDLLTARQLLLKYPNNPNTTLLNEKLKELELYFNIKE